MSQLNRKQVRKMLLKEFKMMGMAPMGASMIGHSPFPKSETPHGHDDVEMVIHSDSAGHQGVVECCECPDTKAMLRQCCEDILSRC